MNPARRTRRNDSTNINTTDDEAQRLAKAWNLIKKGELSHAARSLKSSGLAPGTLATLNELSNPVLRPSDSSEPLPSEAFRMQPSAPFALDKDVFATVLGQSRRGKSAGLNGNRKEYLRLFAEESDSFNLLHEAAEQLSRAEMPEDIA